MAALQRTALKDVLGNFMEMARTPQEDAHFQAMFDLDDAIAIWQELDAYKQGKIPAD